MFWDPAAIDPSVDSRSVSFENPTGGRGSGGTTHKGRKGAPSGRVGPGEKVVLCDLAGPGRVTHIWMTVPPGMPEQIRSVVVEGFYNGEEYPSISAPMLDLFGVPHGRPVSFTSALATMQEARGFNLHVPMPFQDSLRLELTNHGAMPIELYYQVDYVLCAVEQSYLHVSWRRENPTTLGRDMVISEGIRGPGRFLGCNVGVRVLDDGIWYGEGEVKIFRDGDRDHPTICGTGLEDYVGTAWGMGPHAGLWAGAPLDVRRDRGQVQPDMVGFYRWHVPDPIMFSEDLRVTIQQIGAAMFFAGQEDDFESFAASHPVAGRGWWRVPGLTASGIVERVDDYCATAFVYATTPQSVCPVDPVVATADLGRLEYEQPDWMEMLFAAAASNEPEVFRPRQGS